MTTFLATAIVLGLLARMVLWTSQLTLLRRDPRGHGHGHGHGLDLDLGRTADLPVSVLRPMKGLDPGLEANLHSLFRQDYPAFEVLLGVEDASDPALDVARRVASAYPSIASVVVVDARKVGFNPKVNNLANLVRRARHEVLLVSDSNVAVERGYLRDLVVHLGRPGVKLVTSPIRGVGYAGLGGALESLQLNGFVMSAVAFVGHVLGMPCVVGKSMLFRRADLEAIGGFPFLGRYLAEDQVTGEEIARRGGRIALASQPVNNVLGRLPLASFVRRHLRWGLIRSRLCPLAYTSELLLEPVGLATLLVAIAPGVATVSLAVGSLALIAALTCAAERELGVDRPVLVYPALELVRSVLVLALWPVPLFRSAVVWRGNTFHVHARTRLRPAHGVETRREETLHEETVLAAHA